MATVPELFHANKNKLYPFFFWFIQLLLKLLPDASAGCKVAVQAYTCEDSH